MKVKPNLFLNMSPQTTEEGGLAFARNMKLDDDGNLVSDYGYKNITCTVSNDATPAAALNTYNIIGHIVGLDNKIYFFTSDDKIIEYDEVLETATKLDTHWTYNNGEIDGYVSTNQSGEKILTIAEYKSDGHVPLKHINLKFPKIVNSSNVVVSDETIYNQAPKCPTANLVLKDTYVKTIPNGVYVFFIRYKIRKDVYTNWFLCSRPIFGGTSEKITTLQGGLSYINLHKDSAKSFIFQLDFAVDSNKTLYKEFQLGFIITHDEATDARMWKHFDTASFKTSNIGDTDNLIYFDYEDVEEANIDDLLETTYELYNVRNVTSFKNKLYISNYIETDFNPDLKLLADKIHLSIAHSGGTDINYRNLKLNSVPLKFNYEKGYYDKTDLDNKDIAEIIANRYFFNYDISKLSKVSSKEKSDVVLFDILWKGDADNGGYNPDIAIVYNIYNNLYNKVIFGNDYGDPYSFTIDGSHLSPIILNGMGIKRVAATSGNLYGYRHDDTEHPWYRLGLTFAFGSFSDRDVGSDFARDGAFAFNISSENIWSVDGVLSWPTRDSGFIDSARNFIDNELKRQIEGKSFWGKAYIEISSGGNTYTIGYDSIMDLDNYAGSSAFVPEPNSYFSTETISSGLESNIKDWIFAVLHDSNYLVGIDESGIPVIRVNNKDIRANSVSVKFKKFDFKVESEELTVNDLIYNKRYRVSMTTTDYVSVCTFNFVNGIISIGSSDAPQASTLMPYSKYQPYIHFVDEHNIITNGIKCDNPIQVEAATSNADIISLKYYIESLGNIPIAANYKSFFISLVNIGNIVMEGFGYSKDPNSNTTNILHCIEIDAMLYNINDNIIIVDSTYNLVNSLTEGTPGVITIKAKYYSSGSSYPTLAFGNCGYVSWEGRASDNYANSKLYIIVKRNKSLENVNNLVKSSSYIKLEQTGSDSNPVDVPDGYYGAWLSFVKKPSFDLSSSCYVAGNDVYSMDRNTSLALRDFNGYVQIQNSVTYFIRSNYNLNYLSLTEDVTDKIFSVGNVTSGVKQVAKVINSAILSFIYELKPMYKDFANKYFRKYDSDYKIDFDNTIRVSHVLSDETFNNSVFKFSAEDYYNVPTDRGIIVNLFAIGNNIFVHCKGSLYKFDGNTTISANNQDIQLQESEPFNTGISQIFDSEYGYGGIDNKQSGCITFDSYFFYDKASNHIFAYGGNSQVQMIDGNIYKLLTYYKPTGCKVLHDELNCRILFEFTSGRSEHISSTYKTFTLSYNYKTKTFVSIHDLSLVNAFAGRYRDYSYKGDGNTNGLLRLFEMEQSYTHQEIVDEETVDVTTEIDVTPFVPAMNINKIFGNATTACIIEFGASLYKKQVAPFGIAVVLFPKEDIREVINSVKYIGDVQRKNTETQSNPIYDVIVNPQIDRDNPVVNFYIITDCCVSSVVNSNTDDEARPDIGHINPKNDKYYRKNGTATTPMTPSTLMDYKGFKYDAGFWTTNYFRNNINKDDIYKYNDTVSRALGMDRNSLVYGRYFIIVFDFKADTPIKFEELFMNSEKY